MSAELNAVGDILKRFREKYPQTFNNVEFYEFMKKHGIQEGEAKALLKRLNDNGEVFSTYEGVWKWV